MSGTVLLRRLVAAGTLVLALTAGAQAAEDPPEITIEETRWGFDGSVPRRMFSPLSLLVNNPGEEAFEGTFQLTRKLARFSRVGTVLEREVYVGPGSQTWVQFAPYVVDDWEEWTLSWGDRATESLMIPAPTFQHPGCVALVAGDRLTRLPRGIKVFPAELFPPRAPAAESLGAVLLDELPRWQEPRRSAFLDWMRGGGTLILTHDVDGRFPAFPPEWEPLDQVKQSAAPGAGHVLFWPVMMSGITAQSLREYLEEAGVPRVAGVASPSNETSLEEIRRKLGSLRAWDGEERIFSSLAAVNDEKPSIFALLPLLVLYLVLAGPVSLWFGRRARRLSAYYAAFCIASLALCGLFWSLNYGISRDSQIVVAASAYELEPGRYDVASWSSIRSRGGGRQDVEFSGEDALCTTGVDLGAVAGTVRELPQAHLTVHIPLNSSLPIKHRAIVPGPEIALTVGRVEFVSRDYLNRFEADVQLPAGWQLHRAVVVVRDYVYSLQPTGGRLSIESKSGTAAEVFLNQDGIPLYRWGSWPFGGRRTQMDDPDVMLNHLTAPLLGAAARLPGDYHVADLRIADDRARFALLVEPPDDFPLLDTSLPADRGRVLFVLDRRLPVGAGVE